MADDSGSYLSKIASGFQAALGGGSEEPTCPHCGKKPSDEPNTTASSAPDAASKIQAGFGSVK